MRSWPSAWVRPAPPGRAVFTVRARAAAAGPRPGPGRHRGAGLFRRPDHGRKDAVMEPKLRLDPAVVREARELARAAGQPIVELARTHTTVSVERAVLRLAGLDGADEDGMPWVNRLVDAVRESAGLEHGVALPAWDAL